MKATNTCEYIKSINLPHIALAGQIAPTTTFRQLRRIFGLAISVIGLSASIMSAQANTIPVVNGNFETEFGNNTDPTLNWVKLTGWSFENTSIGLLPIAGNFSSDPDGGGYFTRFTWNDAGVEQNLQTTVSAGDTLSVTFNLGVSLGAWDQDASRVKGNAYFKVGSTYYKMPYDLTGQTVGVWHPFTFTTTIINSGNLSIGFQNLNIANNYYTSLDDVSSVTQTPGVFVNTPPTSSGGSVLTRIDTVKTFAATDFQFSDVDLGQTLQAIKVTSLSTNGTLKLGGTDITAVPSAEILVADIPTLTYTPNTGETGPDSFTFKVSDGTDYSADATMSITVTTDIFVLNGSFEDPTPHNPNNGQNSDWTAGGWAFLPAPWTSSYGLNYSRLSSAPMVGSAQPGPWICNLNGSGIWIKQDLGATVTAADTLSVTFQLMSDSSPGKVAASFRVGATEYTQEFDNPQNGTWVSHTLTQTIGVSGNLAVRFSNVGVSGVSDRSWLDNVSNVSVTPAVVVAGAPSSTDATLTVLEDTETALSTDNFGYSDTNSPPSPLAAVQITAVPLLGTLKLSGSTVTNSEIVAVANIGNLKYQSALNGNGTPYTMIGIKVINEANLWSLPAVMTVNVTPVNDPPTSTGGSVILRTGTVKTFAAANFQYSDVEGDPLSAIKVTSLSTNGTLSLYASPISADAVVSVGDIGALTYTPNTGYTGPDSFNFKVSDGTDYSVADATMAITVMSDILVQNGSFEDPTPHNPNNGTNPDWTAGGWAFVGSPWTASTANYGRLSQGPVASPQLGNWIFNLNDAGGWIKQDLNSSVNAGNTLSVTFSVMSDTAPGEIAASFLVGDGPTEYSQTFNNPQNDGTWVAYTLTKAIGAGVSGNLSLQFSRVSGRLWLDNISNVSVTSSAPTVTITSIRPDGIGNFTIKATSAQSVKVMLLRSPDVTRSLVDWDQASGVVEGTSFEFIDPPPTGETQAFYKLKVIP